MSEKLNRKGTGNAPNEKGKGQKPVTTIRFQEGIDEHLRAKERGERSKLFYKDGSECVF